MLFDAFLFCGVLTLVQNLCDYSNKPLCTVVILRLYVLKLPSERDRMHPKSDVSPRSNPCFRFPPAKQQDRGLVKFKISSGHLIPTSVMVRILDAGSPDTIT